MACCVGKAPFVAYERHPSGLLASNKGSGYRQFLSKIDNS